MKKRYPCVKQHSEEDCGAACLSAIAAYYQHEITISKIRPLIGTNQTGTTLLGLQQGAESLGFNARAVKTTPDILHRLSEAPLPAILHWQGCHWIILYGKKGKQFVIADPAVGLRFLSAKELAQGWSDWTMLLLEPDTKRFRPSEDAPNSGFQRFLSRAKQYKGFILQALFINGVLGLLSLTSPFLIQILTDDVLIRGDLRLLRTVAIAVMALTGLSSLLSFVQANLIANFAQRLELGMTLEFSRTLLQLPLSFFEARRSGEIISRLQDVQEINQLISQVVIGLPSQFFIALVSFGFMMAYSWQLTGVALLGAIAMTLATVFSLPALQAKTRNLLVTEAESQGVLVETFKGALTLKTTDATPQVWQELQGRFSRLAKLSLSTAHIGIANGSFSGLVSGLAGISLLWVGGSLVANPAIALSIGQLLAFKAMNDNFLSLINTLVKFADEFTRAKTAVQRLTEVIDAEPEEPNQAAKPEITLPPAADIHCDSLSFHYPGRLELLSELSLTIPGGKAIALIGQSGCGKSTLAKLLAGLHSPQAGNLRIGPYNLADISLSSLRQQIALVPQDAHFWSRSILENFRLSHPEASFETIVQACELVGADAFISRLPNRYQTVLGEFGANLSGGQKQRLALARALVGNPNILILDESTSGLDPVSEARILDKLLAHRKDQTTILISHRPQVVGQANWVVFLEEGKATVQGSQSFLRRQKGEHLAFLAA